MNKRIFTLLLSLFSSFFTYSQITPQEAVVQMGRGINLGNTLDDPNGEGKTWGNIAKEDFFDKYATAGFSSVRIPITWNSHVSTASPYLVDTSFMNRVEELVGWAQERNMWVIINAHHEDWLFEDSSQANFDRLDSIWSQVSTHFKNHSDSLLFEIINEPRTADHALTQTQVDDLNSRVLSIIRKTNPERNIIIGGMGWSSDADLKKMRIPEDNHLIGYFHSYNPWDFAGEGNGTWGTTSDVNDLKSGFESLAKWSATNNIPVYLGEFGGRTRCDFNSRMKWYAMYVETAIENDFAFSTWDDNGWFQVLKRSTLAWTAPKDILVNFSPQNPSEITLENHNGDSVQINWVNRSEEYTSIQIERGTSSIAFEPIATLTAEQTSYQDKTMEQNKTYYYRVTAVLGDEKLLLSYPQKIKTTHVGETGLNSLHEKFDLYPNPTKNAIHFNEKVASVEVTETTGEKIKTYYQTENIDLTTLRSGVYILNIQLQNGTTFSRKITKN